MKPDHDGENDITRCVGKALANYFQRLDGERPIAVYMQAELS